MSRYSIFSSEEELSEWLMALSGEKCLVGIVFSGRDGRVSEFNGHLTSEPYRAFFYPASLAHSSIRSLNDVRAREWGWLDVRPGGVRVVGDNRILLMTTIAADDSPNAKSKPSGYVRWLKRHTAKRVHRGVVGRNVNTQAEATYGDIYYTTEALNEFNRGTFWKQNETDRIVFFPMP